MNQDSIKFITIRSRGKQILDRIAHLPASGWKNVTVDCAENKDGTLYVCDEMVFLKGYDKDIRQITITGNRAQTLCDKFVLNSADILKSNETINVQLKNKRELPLILEVIPKFKQKKYSRLGNKNIIFEGASYSLYTGC